MAAIFSGRGGSGRGSRFATRAGCSGLSRKVSPLYPSPTGRARTATGVCGRSGGGVCLSRTRGATSFSTAPSAPNSTGVVATTPNYGYGGPTVSPNETPHVCMQLGGCRQVTIPS